MDQELNQNKAKEDLSQSSKETFDTPLQPTQNPEGESVLVRPLETFSTDVEKYLQEHPDADTSVSKALERNRSRPASTPPPDPKVFILPSKQIHSPLNARRVEAGTLLKQEERATLPKVAPPAPRPVAPPPKISNAEFSVETYKRDIENLVKKENVTSIDIAAAEAQRRGQQPLPAPASHIFKNVLAVTGGLALILLAGGAFAFAYIHSRALPPTLTTTAPYIAVDETRDIKIESIYSRQGVVDTLMSAKKDTHESAGLISQFRLFEKSTTSLGVTLLPAQTFLRALAPNIPPELLRTIRPEFIVGVHSFDINQSFIIFSVDSYQGGYAGMLAWENTLQHDLSPLFDYSPVPSNQPTVTAEPSIPSQVLQSPFIDLIVENHDARVIKDASQNVLFLWTFLDHSTVLITTNPNTVHEIISRQRNAPRLNTGSK